LLQLANRSALLYEMEIRLLGLDEETLAAAYPPPPPSLVQMQTMTGTTAVEALPGQQAPGAPLPDVGVMLGQRRSQEVGRCPVTPEAANRPLGYVVATGGPDLVTWAEGAVREGLATAGAAAAVVALFLGLFTAYRLSRPLAQLTETAAAMGRGDLAARAPAYGRDEVGRLAAQFNEMAGRVEASVAALEAERDTLRRFMSDASHELRTPITALRSFNELLREGAVAETAVREEFLAESAAQIERMTWIINHLLDLTRLDAGVAALEKEPRRAADLLEEAAAPFRRRAKEAGVRLHLNLPASELTVRCDRARVLLALSNLLDNALKFTPAGGSIEAGAERSADELCFWVKDTGRGIPPGVLSRIFERFYRGEGDQSGSGLGLAIVKSVAEAHGGRAAAESAPGAGSVFTVCLPLAALEERAID
jgi:two-component system sensor histidine kinase BaeS